MQKKVRITSKRQITIPKKLYDKLDFQKGEVLVLRDSGGGIMMEKPTQVLDDLAGSVKLPNRFQGLSSQEIVKKAKKEYFSAKD